jgi:hypothetical protein
MHVTHSIFCYPQVKNKPCVYWAYAFILELSTVANTWLYTKLHRMTRLNIIFILTQPTASYITLECIWGNTPVELNEYAKQGPADRRRVECIYCRVLHYLIPTKPRIGMCLV